MNPWILRVLAIIAGAAVGVGIYAVLQPKHVEHESLRKQVSLLVTQSEWLADRVRILDQQLHKHDAHQGILDEHDELLARLRLDLNGVLARKPPRETDPTWRAERIPQRLGNLEYEVHGKRP